MLTLFHSTWSRSGRIVWLLEELGVPYALRYCTIQRGGTGVRDAANPHPDGKVPALDHDGVLITESLAIALYLTETFPAAGLGADPYSADRGAYLTWMAWVTGELEPSLWAKINGALDASPDARSRYDQAMSRLLTAVEAGPYLLGDRISTVDIMVGATLGWARAHAPQSAALDAYLARLADRPANKAACAKDSQAETVAA